MYFEHTLNLWIKYKKSIIYLFIDRKKKKWFIKLYIIEMDMNYKMGQKLLKRTLLNGRYTVEMNMHFLNGI
jgi:hypothetical protein